MEAKRLTDLRLGDKVVCLLDGRICDFGYIDFEGCAAIYEEGSRDAHDCSVVDAAELEPLDEG